MMIPNIKQRKDFNRSRTGGRQLACEYRKRALIEGIFGAEETRGTSCTAGSAIAWNIRVLNRFECANRLNIPIPSYGGSGVRLMRRQ